MREGVVSRLSVGTFLCHIAETFRRGESFSVPITSDIEKIYASECYVTVFDFVPKFHCLRTPKKTVGEPFRVQLFSGSKKVWIRGGGEYQDFSSKVFVPQCRNFP